MNAPDTSHRDAWFCIADNDVADDTPDSGRRVFGEITYTI